ncbi:lipid IV(A) 3-deoxy-D-manno-octulosonic acid transferase [Vibrio cholerae]|uniref:lipid IV(A) 3-deoxy-D-manno-octulosonic acid transferase n=1 Tax=Vibrio furnissii TaxID=29494 RepID=UPI00208AB12F|nr:lipid IV(A) 3-deoxy-D-manno-octulosonic acid transferase [Vibrio cholerae]GHY02489.1 3-deoxy-D-manno-octulosonic acid transferase [Vibrio cholerae]GIA51236.1 3-deoxy-D-manno-octulosonic acid transferase [Vibrio cholerae]
MLIRWLYTLLLAIISPLLLLGLYKRKSNKPPFGPRWKEHFGLTPSLHTNEPPLWIHAVSVGECMVAVPLIKTLKQRDPHIPIIVTTTTSTGAAQIKKLEDLVEHRYMPFDFPFAIQGFLRSVRPTKMIIIETELWPNTLYYVHRAGIPIQVINARLSAKSAHNYARIRPLFNLIAPCLKTVFCQTKADAERFASLGLSTQQLCITGSIKYDITISNTIRQAGQTLRQHLGSQRPIWIAASTHQGEDEQVLAAHQLLLIQHPHALLILVPRHPERFDDVFRLCQERGFFTARRTDGQPVTAQHQIYLADTMGEMLTLLGAADVCFMGGSLAGEKVGGHNILEPAALGVPVISGPSYYNFYDIVSNFLAAEAMQVIHSPQELAQNINELLSSPTRAQTYSQRALIQVKNNQGALNAVVTRI